MEPESILSYSQEPATGPYSDPSESSPHPHALLLQNILYYYPTT
jgi:hypothetical protein